MGWPSLVETNMTNIGKVGSYSAFNGMWYSLVDPTGFVFGRDFTIGARFDPAKINKDVLFGWQLPKTIPNLAGVRGYLNIAYGNYEQTDMVTPIVPKKTKNITTLTCDFRYQKATEYPADCLVEAWISATAHATGSITDRDFEVGYLPSAPDRVYAGAVTQVGTFSDRAARTWKVSVDQNAVSLGRPCPYIMAIPPLPETDVQGVLFLDQLFNYAQAQGITTGEQYYNGHGAGIEPVRGNGCAMVSSVVDYA